MEMSETVIDNLTKLYYINSLTNSFYTEEDANDLLRDPICNFKHLFIEYLIKTGWNGWLIVTNYLGGVIRKSILNEVIDYCNYVQCASQSDKGKSVPLWFTKLHEDTIFLLLLKFHSFCLSRCFNKRIRLSYEANMIGNTLTILAKEATVPEFESTLIGYQKIQPFPKVLSGHQSILDTLFSIYVASREVEDLLPLHTWRRFYIRLLKESIREYGAKIYDEGENQDNSNCVLNGGGASWVLKPCSNTKLVDCFEGGEKGRVEEEMGGGNQEVQNCLDILQRCIEENEKAMMCRSIEKCCKEVYDQEEEEEERGGGGGGMIKAVMINRCFDDYRLEGESKEIETTKNVVLEEEEEEEEEEECYARARSLVEELLM